MLTHIYAPANRLNGMDIWNWYRMSNEQEQMRILKLRILTSLNLDGISSLLDQLEMFGHKSLPYMSEILSLSRNSDTVRTTNFCISRIKQRFERLDS
jgi:hypothetical protein